MSGHVVKRHVIVVDPDTSVTTPLRDHLSREGYTIEIVDSAQGLRQAITDAVYDVIIIDLDLPDENGLTVLRELRTGSSTGLIVQTARNDSVDRIVALEMGADQYVIKPVAPREIAVRVRNLIWRLTASMPSANTTEGALLRFEDWTFDVTKRVLRSVSRGNSTLTRQESSVLFALLRNAGKVLTRDQLMDAVNREWAPTDRTIDVLIGRLRRKIEIEPATPELIITLYGEGYMFAGMVL